MKRADWERLGRKALELGWPHSLHNERLKRAGRQNDVDDKDDDEYGYWDWWPDFSDELTALACIPWANSVIGSCCFAFYDDGSVRIWDTPAGEWKAPTIAQVCVKAIEAVRKAKT